MSKGYNGWVNWQTWNVNLWLANEEPLYRATLAQARRNQDPVEFEQFVRELLPDGTPDMDSVDEYDVVDWDEVLDGFAEDLDA